MTLKPKRLCLPKVAMCRRDVVERDDLIIQTGAKRSIRLELGGLAKAFEAPSVNPQEAARSATARELQGVGCDEMPNLRNSDIQNCRRLYCENGACKGA
jgi:hypothetical protein